MKMNWSRWIRAVCAKPGIEPMDLHVNNGLQLKRFSTPMEYRQFQASASGSWLVITSYLDQGQMNWLQIYRSSDQFQHQEAKAMNGSNLAISNQFFATQQQEFIGRAFNTLALPVQPILLDEAGSVHWQWIMEKIACNMECNYVFRKELLQELVLQAIHFILKRDSLRYGHHLTVTT